MQPQPHILALDFDGVLCDGLHEYFQTTLATYQQIWPAAKTAELEACRDRFYQLRPLIETGWEMLLLLRALVLGMPDADIARDWSALVRQLLATDNLDSRELARRLDATRDRWLHNDLDGWLRLHRFYPGASEQLQTWLRAGQPQLFIVTTKEGRFAQQLLREAGVALPAERILGKEIRQPKAVVLRRLRAASPEAAASLWFVEDRLATLQAVAAESDLRDVDLFLADWGYNTAAARAIAQNAPRLHLLSLAQFTGAFEDWRPSA